jgi:hypothetical protein
MTDFVNLKIKSSQFFKGGHTNRIHIYIYVNDHIYIYINICIYIIFLKKIELYKNLCQHATYVAADGLCIPSSMPTIGKRGAHYRIRLFTKFHEVKRATATFRHSQAPSPSTCHREPAKKPETRSCRRDPSPPAISFLPCEVAAGEKKLNREGNAVLVKSHVAGTEDIYNILMINKLWNQ